MSEITLIFPHQLFRDHPGLADGRPVYLIESPLLFGVDPVWPLKIHVQKLIFHRASMKAYASELENRGHEVHYLDCEGGKGLHAILVTKLKNSLETIHLCELCDQILAKRVAKLAKSLGAKIEAHSTPMFLTPRDWLDEQLKSKKKPFMANFYKAQRKRMKIMVDEDGEPLGGQWSYDEDNRKKLPKNHECPPALTAPERGVVTESKTYVEENFTHYIGSAESFAWPVTHQDADEWLDRFLEERLANFGPYEDALSTKERTLYHSQLTPVLNSGLITPQEVIDRTLKFAKENEVPINSLEGFVRQIIGWREFMFGMYRYHGVRERTSNFWGFERKMPEAFYTGETGIPPIDQVIKRALDHSYNHHIERLMVIGSFMLLCRIEPTEVYRWFMELFIDAYDWVMVPNVYGMSQFADGGIFTTKPYLCGSNYIRKMSDYPKGDWCEVWDGLYWTFIADYKDVFAGNHRMAMMARMVEKMDAEKLETHRKNAQTFLDQLN